MVKNIKIQEPHGLNLESYYHGLNYTRATMNSKPWVSRPGTWSSLPFSYFYWIITIGLLIVGIVGVSRINKKVEPEEDSCSTYYYCYTPSYPETDTTGILMAALGFTFAGCLYMGAVARYWSTWTKGCLNKLNLSEGGEPLNGYINNQKTCEVEMHVTFECYHNETRTSVGANGQTTYYTVKVTSHSDSHQIPVAGVTDITKPLLFPDVTQINSRAEFIKVEFERNWIPFDEQSSIVIKTYVDYLTLVNQNKDDFFNISVNVTYRGFPFKDHIICSTNNPDGKFDDIPSIYSRLWYFLSCITLWFPIYESMVSNKFGSTQFVFLKSVKVDKPMVANFVPEPKVVHIVHPQIQAVYTVPGAYPPQPQYYPPPQGVVPQGVYQYPPQQPPPQYYYPPPPQQQQYHQPIQMETFNYHPPQQQQQQPPPGEFKSEI